MRTLIAMVAELFLSDIATAQKTVSFPTKDGGVVSRSLRNRRESCRACHGGRFNEESWAKQASKRIKANA